MTPRSPAGFFDFASILHGREVYGLIILDCDRKQCLNADQATRPSVIRLHPAGGIAAGKESKIPTTLTFSTAIDVLFALCSIGFKFPWPRRLYVTHTAENPGTY